MRRQYNKVKSGGGSDMLDTCFFVEDISGSDNTLQIKKSSSSAPPIVLEYSYDQDTWQDVGTNSTTATKITIPANGKVYLRGVNSALAQASSYNSITATQKHNAGGNIMSLLYGEDFTGKYVCENSYSFMSLFYYNKTLVDVTNLRLPAVSLANNCYQSMFQGCTSLVTAPELPATSVGNYSYAQMFIDCISLTTAPELPATSVGNYSYAQMFYGCSSLTTAPELPATTLSTNCYYYMFYNCTSLVTAPELPATTLADNCYRGMFIDCISLTTAPELPATSVGNYSYAQMFYGCSSLTTAPELPATTLASACYQYMFYNCTSLVTAPELPATTLSTNCYYYMFCNCKLINRIVALFTLAPKSSYCNNWVAGVATEGVFVMSKEATWNPDDNRGVSGVPNGWTIEYI
jgi:hypothetical protein